MNDDDDDDGNGPVTLLMIAYVLDKHLEYYIGERKKLDEVRIRISIMSYHILMCYWAPSSNPSQKYHKRKQQIE